MRRGRSASILALPPVNAFAVTKVVGRARRSPLPPRGARARAAREEARTALVVVPVSLAGLGVTVAAALTFRETSGSALAAVAALLAAAAVSEAFPVPVPGGTAGAMSLATIFIVASGVLHGWSAGTLVGVLSMLAVESRRRKPIRQVLYNT